MVRGEPKRTHHTHGYGYDILTTIGKTFQKRKKTVAMSKFSVYIMYMEANDNFKKVDKMRYEKINSTNSDYVEKIKSAILAGEKITPVVVVENSEIAITGSHRIQAYHELEMDEDMPIVEVSEEEFEATKHAYGDKFGHYYFSEMSEMNEFCEMLMEITASEDVKKALDYQLESTMDL